MKLLVTGGAGFIGSAFVRHTMLRPDAAYQIVNLDKLTYAGNPDNLIEIENKPGYTFVQGDICNAVLVNRLFTDYKPDAIVHFAAESHVDRSILSAEAFFETNLRGTFTLLEAARAAETKRFIHISTDEVYGSIPEPSEATEEYPLKASSPYSASKAGSDLLALSYYTTYKLPVSVTRASNNYGPYQFPEKLIPLMITRALADKPLPVYGDGKNVRDWLHVIDHARAIWAVATSGRLEDEVYNIGGESEVRNIDVVRTLLRLLGKPESLIRFVQDRPGHDRRYAMNITRIRDTLGWSPQYTFEKGLAETIKWYQENREWWHRVESEAYRTANALYLDSVAAS